MNLLNEIIEALSSQSGSLTDALLKTKGPDSGTDLFGRDRILGQIYLAAEVEAGHDKSPTQCGSANQSRSLTICPISSSVSTIGLVFMLLPRALATIKSKLLAVTP